MLLQCFLADVTANQATKQTSHYNDNRHKARCNANHAIYVFLCNVVLLHSADKCALQETHRPNDSAKGKDATENGVRNHHGFHSDLTSAHNQEIADYPANNQRNRDQPESANQQKQDTLNCSADCKHAFLRDFSSNSIITIPLGIATTAG